MKRKHIFTVFGLLLAANAGATSIGFGCIAADGSSGDSCVITEKGLAHKGFDFPDFDSMIKESRVRFGEAAGNKHRSVFPDFSRFSVDTESHDLNKSRSKLHDRLSGLDTMLDDMDVDDLVMGFSRRDMKHADDYWKKWKRPRYHHGHHMPPVPVPASIWLFGSGLLAMVGLIRRRA